MSMYVTTCFRYVGESFRHEVACLRPIVFYKTCGCTIKYVAEPNHQATCLKLASKLFKHAATCLKQKLTLECHGT